MRTFYRSNAGALEREEVSGMWWSRIGAERMLVVRRDVVADSFEELWACGKSGCRLSRNAPIKSPDLLKESGNVFRDQYSVCEMPN